MSDVAVTLTALGGEYMESATIVAWLVKEGDLVAAGQPIVTVETAKVSTDIEAPVAGTIRGLSGAVGEEAAVGGVLAWISPVAERRVSPLARRYAGEQGVDIAAIAPATPGAPVSVEDVKAYLAKQEPKAAPLKALLVIGYGKMGAALLDRFVHTEKGAAAMVVEPDPAARARAAAQGYAVAPSLAALPEGAAFDLTLIAVKPQQLPGLGAPLAGRSVGLGTVVSILAGARLDVLAREFDAAGALVRAMPNLPARIGQAVSACRAAEGCPQSDRARAEAFLAASGAVVWLTDEAQFDAVTAISGSGPAYVFHLLECLEQAGLDLGLAPEIARTLATETVAGAAALARLSDQPAEQLRRDVASKGGTTEAALAVLAAPKTGLQALLTAAVRAAAARSAALGRGDSE